MSQLNNRQKQLLDSTGGKFQDVGEKSDKIIYDILNVPINISLISHSWILFSQHSFVSGGKKEYFYVTMS